MEEGCGSMAIEAAVTQKAEQTINAIVNNIETVIKGKHETVMLTVLALAVGGHVLLEDVPGVGKTSLVSALAKSIDCGFRRIQFTPDVMPSDVSGFSIFNQKTRDFEFRPGAVMTNIVLADEINRASAKTQSALLEVMEERQVTVDSVTYPMAEPFMVLATQNPLESFGTYPLPEAQIDRFLVKLSLGYPSIPDERQIILGVKEAKASIKPVANGNDVIALQKVVGRVHITDSLATYLVEIVNATRTHADLKRGASPRGSLALLGMARAWALANGRDFVRPDDVKYLAPFVLAHRVELSRDAKTARKTPHDVINAIVGSVAVPLER